MRLRFLVPLLFVIFAGAVGAAEYLSRDHVQWATTSLRDEAVKALLQLAVIIVAGGVVTALFKSVERTRERLRVRSEVRTDYLVRLGRIYRTVKSTRRALRACGLTTKHGKVAGGTATDYTAQMGRLGEAQLELEGMKIEASSLPAFRPIQAVVDDMGTMESYVRRILSEYEKYKPQLRIAGVPVNTLERLREYTADSRAAFSYTAPADQRANRRFSTHFSEPFERVVSQISVVLYG